MIIRINKFEVTLFVALLIIAGLFIVLGLLLNLIMRAAKMLFCKNEHTLSYKVVSFTAPLVLLIMWYIANFTSQYEIDRYILSFWPVVLAILMGVVLGLSVASRNTGSLLFFAIFAGMVMRMIRSREYKTWIKNIILCYVPATAISLIYPVFLQIRFGNWKMFMDCQYGFWLRVKSNIFKTIWVSLQVVFTDTYKYGGETDAIVLYKINEAFSLLLMALLVFLIIREIRLMRRGGKFSVPSVVAVIYSVLFIIALCMTIRDPEYNAPTACYYRYYASLFPMYLGLGRFSEKTVQICMFTTALITLLTASVFCLGVFFF